MQIVSKAKDNLGILRTEYQTIVPKLEVEETTFKNEIEEITDTIVQGINRERKGTKYKPVTHKEVALRFNLHPATRKDITQRRFILKKCMERGYGKAFYYFTKIQ